MAFSNLFTTLPAVENATSPSEPWRKLSSQICEPQQASHTRKRKACQTEANQAKRIKTHLDKSAGSNKHYDKPTEDHTVRFQDGQTGRSVCFTKEHRGHKGFRNNVDHNIHNRKTVNNQNGRPQLQPQKKKKKKKKKKKSNQQDQSNRECFRGKGRHQGNTYKGGKQHTAVERKRNMSQEFKDQNALEVDGRLLCIHFVRGRCIKGDECQLEHTQIINNTIKDVCKFYIQGCCTKGENCPYMHKSFPCKFFHTKGRCSQGAECRFSHEALTDITKALLDAALKRDKDLSEITKKAQCDQSLDKGEPPITDNIISTIPLQPIRPNFYNSSSEHCVDTVPIHSQDGGLDSTTHGAAQDTQPTSNSSPHDGADGPSSMAKQVEAPYSVDAVLGSIREVKHFSCGEAKWPLFRDSPTPDYAPTLYTPVIEKVPDLSLSNSPKHKSNVYFPENEIMELQKPKKQGPPPQRTTAFLLANTHPGFNSVVCKNVAGDKPLMENDSFNRFKVNVLHPISKMKTRPHKTETEKKGDSVCPASSHSHIKANKHLAREINYSHDSLPKTLNRNDTVTDSKHCKTKASHPPFGPAKPAFTSLFSNPLSQNQSHPCRESYTISHNQNPDPEIKRQGQKAPTGSQNRTEPRGDTQTITQCGRKMAVGVESAGACSNAGKILFHSLFASPITENNQPEQITMPPIQTALHSPGSQRSVRTHSSPCSTYQSIKVTPAKPSEPDAINTKPLRSLSAPSFGHNGCSMPSSPIETDDTFLQVQVEAAGVTPAIGNDARLDSSTRRAQDSLTHVSSHNVETSTKSILKKLFLCLSPYCEDPQDNIASSVSSECETEDKKSNFTMQHVKRDELVKKKVVVKSKSLGILVHPSDHQEAKDLHIQSSESPDEPRHPIKCQASPQLVPNNQERSGGCRSPSVGPSQMRTLGMHSLPIKPMVSMTGNSRSEQKQSMARRVESTALKNMFKVLDPAASPFGQC